MGRRQLRKRYEMSSELHTIEKKVVNRIFEAQEHLQKLNKLKDYATMNRCKFREEQLDKLLKERNNGKNR